MSTTPPPSEYGAGLTAEDAAVFGSRWIAATISKARGVERITAEEAKAEYGFKGDHARAGILIPLFALDGEVAGWQLRPDEPAPSTRKGGKPLKYITPSGQANVLDVHPERAEYVKTARRLWITEGPLKGDALTTAGEIAASITGVWNFKGKTGRKLADGSDEKAVLSDLDQFVQPGVPVFIAFDSDARENAGVRLASEKLKAEISKRGGLPRVILPPPAADGSKQGVDDYLAAGGTIEALLISQPEGTSFNSWDPVKLSSLDGDPLKPDLCGDTLQIYYPGAVCCVYGAPESKKTLIVYATGIVPAIRLGLRVALIDFEMGGPLAVNMLRDLGATEEEIDALDYYDAPDGAPSEEEMRRLVDRGYDLVVIDAAAGSMEVSGVDDNKRIEIERWQRRWVRPLKRSGAGVVIIDHVPHGVKKLIGSERKLGGIEAAFFVESISQLSKGGRGKAKILISKDKPGGVRLISPGGYEIEFTSDPETYALTFEVKLRSRSVDGDGEFLPTGLMEKCSKYIEANPAKSVRAIREAVGGKSENVSKALVGLENHSYVTVEEVGNSKRYECVRPFRDEEWQALADAVNEAITGPSKAMTNHWPEDKD